MRPEIEQELSHTLLTELLAYQFASPVRWIETQDVFLKDHKTERVVEIGPSPTLAGMASRTIKAKYESFDAALSLQRQVLCYSKDANQIYYTPDPADLEVSKTSITKSLEKEKSSAAPAAAPAATPVATPAAAPAASEPAPVAAPTPSGPVAAIADEPTTAALLLHVLVAQKLKKPLDAVPVSKAIKDLVNGKSTVQNEILGDLGKEFGSTPEKPEETPLNELSEQFQDSFSGQLGKTSTGLIGRLMAAKMPGGYSVTNARKYLNTRYGFGPGRQDSTLLLALVNEPAARLASENDAKTFFDGLAQKHASMTGISLSSGSDSGTGAGGAGGAVIDSAALDAVTAESRTLAKQQLETLARYLKIDLNKGAKSFIKEKDASSLLQKELDLWEEEHGEFYAKGIKPIFSSLKSRTYDSYWNWARQDVISMYFDIIFGKLTSLDRETINQCIQIMNRANPTLIKFMQYHIDHTPEYKGETYQLAKKLGQQLIDNCKQVLDVDPAFKDVSKITKPSTKVDSKGNIVYEEVEKSSVRKFEQYVYEMAQGGELTKQKTKPTIQEDLARVYKTIIKQQSLSKNTKVEVQELYEQLINYIDTSKEIDHRAPIATGTTTPIDEEPEELEMASSGSDDEIASLPDKTSILQPVSSTIPPQTIPFLNIQRMSKTGWEYDSKLSSLYLDGLESCAVNGLTFKGKEVLVTGAGAGSIGAEVLQGLISGGAKVIVTTSRFSKKTTEYYQTMYSRYGSTGSTLIVVPFNQGSVQDVNALIDYIYNDPKQGGLGWDLDVIIPFAAIPENGNGLDNIDSKSELAHRIMLTNLLRLLGKVKARKLTDTRPAQVILPLSPNHGTFGFDGLYSESKIALETLFNRWYSEDWGTKLTICGTVIGWTRGTGLMSANNIIAEGIEKAGVRTFSQKEMAFNILGLLTPQLIQICQEEPIMADLNGGLHFIDNLKEFTSKLRTDLIDTADIKRAVAIESSIEQKIVHGENVDSNYAKVMVTPRSNMKFDFPGLKSYKQLKEIAPDLEGMLDLESVIVVTGFSEVGPWGNSRTRWEMECKGEFSLEGAIEMAWIMGLIKYHNRNIKGKPYSGWVDAKTQAPVEDSEIKSKYEEHILEHSGIRLIEPELFDGYDPNKKRLIQEIVVQHDLEPFEGSKEVAEQYKRQHEDKCEIFEDEESGEYSIRILKGATLYIPKALRFDRLVAGQIPTGWNAKTYGIDDDIIKQVDPVTLYALVSTVEALLSSGVTDPYEFYKYIHISELGNCTGSGMGGISALKGMFRDRFEDKPVQNDILQESFINTMSAWINMLLLSSSGPIRTPVGACATAIESVELGIECILSKKAKICIVGGFDDFQEDSSTEFGNMNATSNTYDEFAHGRTPAEMSRPTTTTRSGFMESQGSGTQVVMSADLAIRMGVPIHGILAMTSTASDKIGKSIPAPGKGILTTAREYHGDLKFPSSKLNIKYRARQLKQRLQQIESWRDSEFEYIHEEAELAKEEYGNEFSMSDFLAERTEEISREAKRQISNAKRQWGNEFYQGDPRIAPLRGALATFGLTIDDLGVASFHGTSTKANDKNETLTVHSMLKHLGRTEGNPVFGVFQKFLTGHPKGAAGAWMLNGALQILETGIVPGNRNADNVDKVLEDFDNVLFPSRSIQTDGIKAVSVTSFGFGQKGAQSIVIHPDYLFAVLDQTTYENYATKVAARHKKTYRYMHNAITRNTMFVEKTKAPYSDDLESHVYLDPLARVGEGNELKFSNKSVQSSENYVSKSTSETAKALAALNKSSKGVGVDVELLSAINLDNETFVERNFTKAEQEYCFKSSNPQASFTGTWSAKEATFKALGVKSQGAGASLIDIEITRDAKGVPKVQLLGSAKVAAEKAGVKSVNVSISHDDFQATAVALSEF